MSADPVVRDDRWEVWRCARCGREQRQPVLPHDPPSCCGTGMWWIRFTERGTD